MLSTAWSSEEPKSKKKKQNKSSIEFGHLAAGGVSRLAAIKSVHKFWPTHNWTFGRGPQLHSHPKIKLQFVAVIMSEQQWPKNQDELENLHANRISRAFQLLRRWKKKCETHRTGKSACRMQHQSGN